MDDDDEIDVLGDFNLENLLCKNEEQMWELICFNGVDLELNLVYHKSLI